MDKIESESPTMRKSFHELEFGYHVLLGGHLGCVNALAFSGGYERFLASGSDDTTIIIRDLCAARTGDTVGRLCGHTANVFFIKFGSSDSEIFSCGLDGMIHFYDVNRSSLPARKLLRYEYPVYRVDISSTRPNLVSVATTGGFSLYDRRVGSRTFHRNTIDELSSAVFHPSAECILISGLQGRLEEFDIRNLCSPVTKYNTSFNQREMNITSCVYNQSGTRILVSAFDNFPILYVPGFSDPRAFFISDNLSHVATLKCFEFGGPNDEFVLAGSNTKKTIYWNVRDLKDADCSSFDDKTRRQLPRDIKFEVCEERHSLGHSRGVINRSIMHHTMPFIFSAGVENNVHCYSPFELGTGYVASDETPETLELFDRMLDARREELFD